MTRQMLRNGQLTLPKEAIEFFNLQAGDSVDIKFNRTGIHIKPLIIEEFSEEEYALLAKKLRSLKGKEKSGKVFKTTEEAMKHIDSLMKH